MHDCLPFVNRDLLIPSHVMYVIDPEGCSVYGLTFSIGEKINNALNDKLLLQSNSQLLFEPNVSAILKVRFSIQYLVCAR